MKTLVTAILSCILFLCFSSCNSFFKFTSNSSVYRASKEAIWSATVITKGKVNKELETFTLYFSPSGKVIAKCKSCDVKGYWYEDALTNTFIMSFDPNENICLLNKSWNIEISGSSLVVLKSTELNEPVTLTLRVS